MFLRSESHYDDLYKALGKDYLKEAARVHRMIQKYCRSNGNCLLDVACGTGAHAGYLAASYQVEGLDSDSKMVAIARKKHPALRFHRGDMLTFNLRRPFDAITCLFSSIGYVKTRTNLGRAIKNMSRHLCPGGVLLVEPWFSSHKWNVGRVHTLLVDKPELKITRMSHSRRRRNLSIIEFQYLVGTKAGIEHFTEQHELGLFSHADHMAAFRTAGLQVVHDKEGLDGRGLYIGVKPVA